ncbi:MAG: 3'(2'),5'-bisphosphate nucleotidase [Gemmatimonadetes bacterium]|nr:3'(2'),5'-bisphosphate nucleotidase [Gemmatimonadota bacterium]
MDDLVRVARRAGEEILRWYGAPGAVHVKEDRTPLTEADRAAHRLLVRELPSIVPGVPVLSEESEGVERVDRLGWTRFWLVDPLDGTKEFLKGTGEFTVNVALIEDGRPVVGVVHVPATGRTYRASPALGAQMADKDGPFRPIRSRPFPPDSPVLVASRDHSGPGVEALARALGPSVQFTSLGSSLKFCVVAEGRADLYLRDLHTMEWDTAAAQCIVERAGGAVYGLISGGLSVGVKLRYNKSTLENPPFLTVGDPSGAWRDMFGEGRGT